MTSVAAPAVPAARNRVAGFWERSFHVGVVLVMTVIVLLGFWPFYSALFHGGTGAHWVIYVHAAVFSGWMILLLMMRRIHRVYVIGLGVLLAAFARVPLMESEAWLVVGRRILLPFPPDGVSG